jgi:hypothetical protein
VLLRNVKSYEITAISVQEIVGSIGRGLRWSEKKGRHARQTPSDRAKNRLRNARSTAGHVQTKHCGLGRTLLAVSSFLY